MQSFTINQAGNRLEWLVKTGQPFPIDPVDNEVRIKLIKQFSHSNILHKIIVYDTALAFHSLLEMSDESSCQNVYFKTLKEHIHKSAIAIANSELQKADYVVPQHIKKELIKVLIELSSFPYSPNLLFPALQIKMKLSFIKEWIEENSNIYKINYTLDNNVVRCLLQHQSHGYWCDCVIQRW